MSKILLVINLGQVLLYHALPSRDLVATGEHLHRLFMPAPTVNIGLAGDVGFEPTPTGLEPVTLVLKTSVLPLH